MKYIPYTLWLLVTSVLVIFVLPGIIIYSETDWFKIGDKILQS